MPTYVLREPYLLFVIVLYCLLVHGSHTPVSYAYICTKSNHLQACIQPHPSIPCCCRPQGCYPCSMTASSGNTVVQNTCIRHAKSHSHPFEAFLVHVNLWVGPYSTIQCTYSSIAIPNSYHRYVHSYTQLQYATS